MDHHPEYGCPTDPLKLQQAFKQLEAANQALARQVAQRTAQLRSLAAELSYAEQRERHKLAQRLHDDLQQLLVGAQSSAHRLRGRLHDQEEAQDVKQVDDLLEQSIESLQSFTTQLSPPILAEGDLPRVLRWLSEWVWKKYDFAVQLDADPQANPQAEEIRITLFHAVRELLCNVLKHAGTRNARVTLAMAGPDHIQVMVSDRGIGFDPAVKLGQGRFGTGLTLFALRERLELLGGRMDVHSGPGQGTQITLVAPVRLAKASLPEMAAGAPAESSAPPAESAPIESRGPRIRVLLADDHAVVRDGLSRLLQAEPDMEVVGLASNGLEAVDLALETHPDVIVMDANMPLLSGVQAARRILGQMPDVKIIALSMYSAADMDLAMRQAGVLEYLTKESAPEVLVATIRRQAAVPAGQQP